MSGKIYLLQNDSRLVAMTQSPYDSEDLLQRWLAEYPDLLAGDQIDGNAPRRWLLVKREMDVPDAQNGSGRWALDHLFLDQDGIPTLVEVKRSADTRLRREVIGQMLDYAANGIAYWPVESLRATFEASANAEQKLADFLSDGLAINAEAEEFWQKVSANLQTGRLRLLFVADETPLELQRVIEFLNEKMETVEVLAVEIKQYVGQQMSALVPRVIGQTTKAVAQKEAASGATRQWDETSYFAAIHAQPQGAIKANIARALLEWARERNMRIWWGKGRTQASFVPVIDINGKNNSLCAVYSSGWIEIYFKALSNKPPFDDIVKRQELLHKLNQITGVSIPPDAISRRPNVNLLVFESPDNLSALLSILDWVAAEIRAS